MKSSSKKQLYVVVMILGGIALVVDRLLLPTAVTDPAEAAALTDNFAYNTPAAIGGVSVETFSIPEVPFPRGVKSLPIDAAVRDLFIPLARRSFREPMSSPADNGRGGSSERDAAGRLSSAAFVTQHNLQGVMVNPRLRIAIVDGAWVRLGEAIDGCRLAGIDGGSARFECFDGEALLSVVTDVEPVD